MRKFNIRVYGILINEQQQILVSDEYILGNYYTKFPGGGLKLGEGTRDCLKREFIEEMNLAIAVEDHLYTTDFFQESAFHPGQQIVSIYYFVRPLEPIRVPLRTTPFDFDDTQLKQYAITEQVESFRFIDSVQFSPDHLTLPIDKIVAGHIRSRFRQ
jgi:8-oxo-dGTP diphosphatase